VFPGGFVEDGVIELFGYFHGTPFEGDFARLRFCYNETHRMWVEEEDEEVLVILDFSEYMIN
jgi:hypothetical protein